jgi:hypothetical protein
MALPERDISRAPAPQIFQFDERYSCEREGRDTFGGERGSVVKLQESTERREHSPPLVFPPIETFDAPRVITTPYQEVPPTPPSSFAEAFTRFEPMFHTVFFRKYHPDVRDDAKQVALLALFLKWSKDKTVFDQTAAFVVTAAVWGISNWRKKEMKRIPHETPLLTNEHGYVIGMPKSRQQGRWTDRVDFQIDLDRAIDAVLWEFNDHPQYKAIYSIVHDLVDDVPFKESWSKTNLPRGEFMKHREAVKTKFAIHLAEYSTSKDAIQ